MCVCVLRDVKKRVCSMIDHDVEATGIVKTCKDLIYSSLAVNTKYHNGFNRRSMTGQSPRN